MKFLKYYNAGISDAMIYGLSEKFNLSPKIIKILVSRGFKTDKQIEEFINPGMSGLHDPFKLKNMQAVIERINIAVENKEKILVFGDYDVDGVSATAIMIKMFEKLNYKVNFYLPNRFIDGYGLTNDVLDKIKKTYKPDLIITVDCGISCHAEVEYAKTLGIEIIVTDHHEIPAILPDTLVLNAKIKEQEYPFRELCGTGLAFKVSQAMLGQQAEEFLPIAAIATIADIVPLLDENRAIVKVGMSLMEKHLPIGLKAMFRQNKLNCNNVTAMDIAFKIAPKLNASGRMGDAKDSLDLYLEKNPNKIKQQIEEITLHNTDRQALCNVVYNDCKKELENQNISQQKCIILKSANWDQGILGIVCARLLDEYNRPVFLFSQIGDVLKGSARSLPEVNVHALLTDMQDILETFGGHTVAAGLTLQSGRFEEFKLRVNSYIHQNINDKVFTPVYFYDEEITLDEIDEKFVKGLSVLEPLGCDNQSPKFKIDCSDIIVNVMKNYKNHANLILGRKLNLVAFNYSDFYYKLKYAKNKSFIFEFQDSRFGGNQFKGLLKEFNCDYVLEEKNLQNVETFTFEQLKYQTLKTATFKQYKKFELLNFISDCALSVFGTAFVFFGQKTLNDFVNNYDIENIYNFDVGENTSSAGFNAVIFCPFMLDWAKNYKRIIFADPIFDKGYISAINQISSAEIFIPENEKFDIKSILKVYAERNNFGRTYNIFKKIDSVEFVNMEAMYQEFYRSKINFQDFYAAFTVFCELGLIKVGHGTGIYVKTIVDKKIPLTNSHAFNFINFIKNTK